MKIGIELPEKQRIRLYPAVLRLLSQNDFHQVNVRTISRESGVSIGTIYKYFESKEDLVCTILEEHVQKIQVKLFEHIQGLGSFKEIFRKFLWVTMDYYDRTPGLAETFFITVPTRTWMQHPAFRHPKDLLQKTLNEALAKKQVDAAVDIRRLQDIFYMICYRLIHSWYYFGQKWTLVEAMERDYELYWKILEPPDEKG
jgi:AcrR family transcriptional regulator